VYASVRHSTRTSLPSDRERSRCRLCPRERDRQSDCKGVFAFRVEPPAFGATRRRSCRLATKHSGYVVPTGRCALQQSARAPSEHLDNEHPAIGTSSPSSSSAMSVQPASKRGSPPEPERYLC